MNLTIRTKLLLGFGTVIILLLLEAVLLSNKLSEADKRLNSIVDISARRVNLSNEVLIAILNVARYEKNMIMERDPIKKNDFKNLMGIQVTLVNKKLPELYELASDQKKPIVNELKTSWVNFQPVLAEIIDLSMKNKEEDAFQLSSGRALQFRDRAITQMEDVIQYNNEAMALDKKLSDESYASTLNLVIALVIISLLVTGGISYWIIQSISKRILFIAGEAEKISSREYAGYKMADNSNDELRLIFNSLININESFREVTQSANEVASGNYALDIVPRSDKDELGNSLKTMAVSLRETSAENEKHNWLTMGKNQLNERLSGDQGIEELAGNTVTFLCNYLHANIGTIYLYNNDEKELELVGQYASSSGADIKKSFLPGEGLIGQVVVEGKQIELANVQDQQMRITSSVLNAKPAHLIITPFSFEGKTMGAIETGKLTPFSKTEKEFINSSMESIGISVNSAIARKRIQELLEETRTQSEELQAQQEELRQANEELEEQSQNLKQQQEELQMTNEELEEQTQSLELKNKEVELSRADIEQKTKQLEISSKYKSEFLANMSHELRTPLNSLLILSKDLSDNKKKNLTTDQVESAEIIYNSGQDLLVLINEVLDLSKIEAGKMTLSVERLTLKQFANELTRNFKHQTDKKGLGFTVTLQNGLPEAIRTDSKRLDQIIKNLMSNAIKFTENGSIQVTIQSEGENRIAIAVKDTGIGVPAEKQMAIFEAFHQGDGSTSRKYGGTGLGLSISRELVKLLGGEIKLTSKVNEGSVFTIILPVELHTQYHEQKTSAPDEALNKATPVFSGTTNFYNYPTIADDRLELEADDKVLLIIEDDLKFAKILLTQAHNKGFKCLAAASGEDGLLLAEKYKPQAIILDLDLPGMDGRKVLAELKANPATRHIPVHIVSVDERTMEPIKEGAVEFLTKPIDKKQLEDAFNRIESFISRKMKNLLIVEDNDNARKAMRKLIGNGDVFCFEAATGSEAISVFAKNHIDCIVLDLGLPDMSGFELIYKLEKIKDGQMPPIIIYTGRELSKEENDELQKYTETIIIKGIKSEERLLDETALFLHRTISNLPESKQKIISGLYDKESIFLNKKILIVDDDMRNVFALSKVLKDRGMQIVKAENGVIALDILNMQSGIDLILMDIMMPVMDGYEAMQKIRAQLKFKKLPVIALTAKAMKDDKQKCIDAGANDYIAKPVDIDRLLSLMRVWLSK
jgi:CheY-like chemotaxis protein/methyl-accepting chemotaxis protein